MTEWEKINRKREAYTRKHTPLMKRSLMRQVAPIIDKLAEMPVNQVSDKVEDLIQPDDIQEGFEKLYLDAGFGFAQDTHERLTGKSRKSDLDDIWEQEMRLYVTRFLGERIKSITGTSKDLAIKIMKDLAETQIIPEGIGVEEASRIFQRSFKASYVQTTLARARVIAQTEILTASNKGSQMGASGAGATIKIWQTSGISSPDGNDRHVGYPGLHGQRRNIGEAYDVRGHTGGYPGDPTLPVSEVVNCHCAEVYE